MTRTRRCRKPTCAGVTARAPPPPRTLPGARADRGCPRALQPRAPGSCRRVARESPQPACLSPTQHHPGPAEQPGRRASLLRAEPHPRFPGPRVDTEGRPSQEWTASHPCSRRHLGTRPCRGLSPPSPNPTFVRLRSLLPPQTPEEPLCSGPICAWSSGALCWRLCAMTTGGNRSGHQGPAHTQALDRGACESWPPPPGPNHRLGPARSSAGCDGRSQHSLPAGCEQGRYLKESWGTGSLTP